MQDFEKLGVFYLGREYDLAAREPKPELLLYDSKDLTTHAVCVGMTGSGKTGLCLALLEEAAIDGVPAIAIDPKGDLGNLLLAFPELRPDDFRPWVDESEAARKSMSVDELAAATAKTWSEGLADWGQDAARIERFRSAVDIAIYTPGSTAGLPLTVLKSFAAPADAILADADALGERIAASVGGLLALVGVEADPLRSREHILLSKILEKAWREKKDLDIGGLIRGIQNPPIDRIGVVDVESFFPAKDRMELAMPLEQPARLAQLCRLDRRRAARRRPAALHARGQAAAVDRVDRASVGRRANVLRHHFAQRDSELGAHAAGHFEPAGDSVHGRNLWLLPAHGQPAVQDADAHAAQAGPGVWSGPAALSWPQRG